MLRRVARLLLGLAFIDNGVTVWRDDGRRAERARSLGTRLPGGDAQQATRAVAIAQVGAGTMLVLGRFPRLSALVLAATVVPDAVTGHAFWGEQDKQARSSERSAFVRELGLLGGLLVAVADTGGRESVPHRAKRNAARAATKTAKSARKAGKAASRVTP